MLKNLQPRKHIIIIIFTRAIHLYALCVRFSAYIQQKQSVYAMAYF